MKTTPSLFVVASLVAGLLHAAETNPAPAEAAAPPVQPLTPEQAPKTFQLPPGYRLEPVLTEPVIKEPVMAAFDGDGRLFVVEMRTYMQDIDGTGEQEPTSRVSLHWSSKGDGVFDQHTVFADKLLLPRILLPLDQGRAIIGETDTNDLFVYTDTNGDGVSDKKELFYQGGSRGGNMEHQPNGLVWSLDNWLYSTYNSYRLRWTPQGTALKEPTAPNGGQWGISQDDYGKLWFINGGGEQGPVNFQTPIVYGAFKAKEQFAPGFDVVWPAIGHADFQGGPSRSRPDGTLNHFTATCGADIYRGDRLPAELRGNLFFGEPVGRLVRRAVVETKDGVTTLTNPYDAAKSEFLRSTDALFRPLNMMTAPDGTLYIVDMYRGIIQEGNWTREGSYLRKMILRHGMDKPIGRGRIWRLVHDSTKLGPQPHMNRETPAQLVAHLAHPNGWWRDTAQKLLILKQDDSAVPELTEMVQTHRDHLARLHALWTLEGLNALTPEMVRARLKDEHPQIRAAALRVSESLYKKGETSLATDIQAATKDNDAAVVVQAILTAKLLNLPEWKQSLTQLASVNTSRGVKELSNQILNPPNTASAPKMSTEEEKLFKAGETAFQSLCATCHGTDGKGLPLVGAAPGAMLAPPLVGSKTVLGWRDGSVHVLLQGLIGDIDGKKYEGQMIPMANNDDLWIAGVLSYVRNSFGNRASFVTPQDVARIRQATRDRTQPWTIVELRAALPKVLTNRKDWKLTASHNTGECSAAIDGKSDSRYTTKVDQTPGQWFLIELPQETAVTGVELESNKSPNDYPRGFKVEISNDGQAWSKPVAVGAGNTPVTTIAFPAARAKFIRVTQTGSVKGLFWSIHELQLFAPADPAQVSANRSLR